MPAYSTLGTARERERERRLTRLVLTEQWDVQEDGERVAVGGEDDELRDAAVERLSDLVCALLELAVIWTREALLLSLRSSLQ